MTKDDVKRRMYRTQPFCFQMINICIYFVANIYCNKYLL
jgi:hypothetical protein